MITRRDLIGPGALLVGVAACGGARALTPSGTDKGEDVSAVEDLMREHGLLERILEVYAECARNLRNGDRDIRATVTTTVAVTSAFVEDYHERLEEQFVFPHFVRTDLAQLVATLRNQ